MDHLTCTKKPPRTYRVSKQVQLLCLCWSHIHMIKKNMKHFSTWPFFQSVVEFYFEKCLQHWKKPGYQTWQAMEHVFLVSNIWLFGVFIASISGGNPQQHTMNPPGFSRCVCINFLEVFYSYTPQKLTWNLKNDGCFNRNLLFVGAHFQVNHVTFSGV